MQSNLRIFSLISALNLLDKGINGKINGKIILLLLVIVGFSNSTVALEGQNKK